MSVPASQRKPSRLEVLIRTRELAIHSLKILANEKVFKPEYASTIGEKLASTALAVHELAWEANSIRIDSCEAPRRLLLQVEALRACEVLLSLIDVAHFVYHLPLKRVHYWGKLVVHARKLLTRWKDSDSRRISESNPGAIAEAQNVWLRSANRGNANNEWNVNSSGRANNNNANNGNRCAPDCQAQNEA